MSSASDASARTRSLVRVTAKDVAERAGVSTAAVSQALNGRGALRAQTRERIEAAARELGYTPDRYAAALRRGRTMSIGYATRPPRLDAADAASSIYAVRQLTALVAAATDADFTVTVIPSARPELLRGARVDAVYAPDARPADPLLSLAAAECVPVVTNDLELPAATGLSVTTGYAQATRAALDLLAAGGARRIGLLAPEPDAPRHEIGEAAYRAWCREHEHPPTIAQIPPGTPEVTGRVRELLREGVDAVFSSAPHGPELFVELSQVGVVMPRDVQLVALCEHDCAVNARLGVTHVCVHPERAPELFFPVLLARLAGKAIAAEPLQLTWDVRAGSTTRANPDVRMRRASL